MSNRLEYNPQPEFEPDDSAQEEVLDDSMQLKRSRLGVEDDVASQNISDESRMRYVDRLMSNAPMLSAPLGFAERVVSRLKELTPRPPQYDEGLGIAIGLLASVVIVIPALAIAIYTLIRFILEESTRTAVWDALVAVESFIVQPFVLVVIGLIVFIYLVMSGYIVWFWRVVIRSAKKLREDTARR